MARPIDIVKKIAPGARREYLRAFEKGDALLAAHGINTPRRLAEFLAQIVVESGGLQFKRESGNYRASRIVQVFGSGHSAKVRAAEARELAGDGPALFERVYGLGNPSMAKRLGNTQPGDGWRYRGNGLLQTTGRYNHRVAGEKVGVDFEKHPELVTSAEHALKPALFYWTQHKCNALADAGNTLAISRAINLGNPRSRRTPNGAAEREALAKKILPMIDSVELKPAAKPNTTGKMAGAIAGTIAATGPIVAAQQVGWDWGSIAIMAGVIAIVAFGVVYFTRRKS